MVALDYPALGTTANTLSASPATNERTTIVAAQGPVAQISAAMPTVTATNTRPPFDGTIVDPNNNNNNTNSSSSSSSNSNNNNNNNINNNNSPSCSVGSSSVGENDPESCSTSTCSHKKSNDSNNNNKSKNNNNESSSSKVAAAIGKPGVKQTSLDETDTKTIAKLSEAAKRGLSLNLSGKELDEFMLKSPKSPMLGTHRLQPPYSHRGSVDLEDRKSLREALYQGIFHRHRKTIFAMGSFLKMLRNRKSHYNSMRSSADDIDKVR